jgi:hypothetical protein
LSSDFAVRSEVKEAKGYAVVVKVKVKFTLQEVTKAQRPEGPHLKVTCVSVFCLILVSRCLLKEYQALEFTNLKS